MTLKVGQLVYVVGLVQAHQHNGKVGEVQTVFDQSSGRCVVMLEDGSTLKIKPENLEATDASSVWLRDEEEQVRLNPPPPLWDEVYDSQSLVWRHPGIIM
jgi:hypothetical protein